MTKKKRNWKKKYLSRPRQLEILHWHFQTPNRHYDPTYGFQHWQSPWLHPILPYIRWLCRWEFRTFAWWQLRRVWRCDLRCWTRQFGELGCCSRNLYPRNGLGNSRNYFPQFPVCGCLPYKGYKRLCHMFRKIGAPAIENRQWQNVRRLQLWHYLLFDGVHTLMRSKRLSSFEKNNVWE